MKNGENAAQIAISQFQFAIFNSSWAISSSRRARLPLSARARASASVARASAGGSSGASQIRICAARWRVPSASARASAVESRWIASAVWPRWI
jgi:hypothetical protein